MGVQIGVRQAVHPARSLVESAQQEFFYAAEAVAVLGVEGIEYRQLRELLTVIRGSDQSTGARRWARYSLADIAALEIAIELVGGRAVFEPKRRMRIAALRRALKALRDAGFMNPLIEVPLERQGTRIVARLRGVLIDPTNGQAQLVEVERRMEQRVKEVRLDGALERLRADLVQLRTSRPRRVEPQGGASWSLSGTG